MKFVGQAMFVSSKLIKKDNLDIPIVNFSDGTDVLMFYDNNKVCSSLTLGDLCDICIDCSSKGVLRLQSVSKAVVSNGN